MSKNNVNADIYALWEKFTKLMKLEKSGIKKGSVQYTEMQKAFMGGCAQMFFLLQDVSDTDDEKKAFETLTLLQNQLQAYFEKQTIDYQKKHN